MSSIPAAEHRLRDLALLRRVRDRIDREYVKLCYAAGCASLGTFSTRFTALVGVPPSVYRRQSGAGTAGMPSCVATQVTRPVRNREAPAGEPLLA